MQGGALMPEKNTLLSISQFAVLSGISRPNLIFYDKEGLLSPVQRKDNNYRLYSYNQITTAYQIQMYRKMGFSLDQIRDMTKSSEVYRNPETLRSQVLELDRQINELTQQKYNMQLYIDALEKYGSYGHKPAYKFEDMPEEMVALSPPLSEFGDSLDTMNKLLIHCREQGITLGCHIGRMFTKRHLDRDEWKTPEHVYFKKIDGGYKKKAGKYLVYTSYSDGTDIDAIYTNIFKYIKKHDLRISGNVFEDYPLSGIFASDESGHFIRIMVPVSG